MDLEGNYAKWQKSNSPFTLCISGWFLSSYRTLIGVEWFAWCLSSLLDLKLGVSGTGYIDYMKQQKLFNQNEKEECIMKGMAGSSENRIASHASRISHLSLMHMFAPLSPPTSISSSFPVSVSASFSQPAREVGQILSHKFTNVWGQTLAEIRT